MSVAVHSNVYSPPRWNPLYIIQQPTISMESNVYSKQENLSLLWNPLNIPQTQILSLWIPLGITQTEPLSLCIALDFPQTHMTLAVHSNVYSPPSSSLWIPLHFPQTHVTRELWTPMSTQFIMEST